MEVSSFKLIELIEREDVTLKGSGRSLEGGSLHGQLGVVADALGLAGINPLHV